MGTSCVQENDNSGFLRCFWALGGQQRLQLRFVLDTQGLQYADKLPDPAARAAPPEPTPCVVCLTNLCLEPRLACLTAALYSSAWLEPAELRYMATGNSSL